MCLELGVREKIGYLPEKGRDHFEKLPIVRTVPEYDTQRTVLS